MNTADEYSRVIVWLYIAVVCAYLTGIVTAYFSTLEQEPVNHTLFLSVIST